MKKTRKKMKSMTMRMAFGRLEKKPMVKLKRNLNVKPFTTFTSQVNSREVISLISMSR
jgi:hypothetical protein